MKKTVISVVLGAAMVMSSAAYAAGAAPLAPGSAAGVHEAQSFFRTNTAYWLLGAGLIVGGIALVASGSGNGHGVVSTCDPTSTGASCPVTPPATTSSTSTTSTGTH